MKDNIKVSSKTTIFCTMFDSYYLDKGLALIRSLTKVCPEHTLYLLAFDRRTEQILRKQNFACVELISLAQFETKELLEMKEERSRAEYCWTCTPYFIEYVFEQYDAQYCTYIDADMYFYHSPVTLLNEFVQSGASVGLTKHAFPQTVHGKKLLKESGKYCVEFNTFKNDKAGRRLLSLWKKQCTEECTVEKCGDQRYLTDWGDKYPEVHDYENPGAGVAPWNLVSYRIKGRFPDFSISAKGVRHNVIFYHFQGIAYSGNGEINMNLFSCVDNGLIPRKNARKIYYPYLLELEVIRSFLIKKYAFHINADSGRMEFNQVTFELSKFLKALLDRVKNGNYFGAVDLVLRVLRKRQDIVRINRKESTKNGV